MSRGTLKGCDEAIDAFYRKLFYNAFACCRVQAQRFAIRMGVRAAAQVREWHCTECGTVWADVAAPSTVRCLW